MSAVALYVIADEYLGALNALTESGADAVTFADTMESLSGGLEAKATNVAMFIRSRQVLAEQMKEAEASIAARRKAVEKSVDNVVAYLKGNMERVGVLKIEGPMLSLRIQANPGAVIIDDEAQVPAFFWRTPAPAPPPVPVIDKAAIKLAIADGEAVPGARVERGTRLVIK